MNASTTPLRTSPATPLLRTSAPDTAAERHGDRRGLRSHARVLKRIVIWLAVAAGVVTITLAWLPDPVPVDLARVERGGLTIAIEEDGRARVKDRYLVSAPVLATMERITLQPGDSVQAGDVIARLLPLEPPMLDVRVREQSLARVAGASAARKQAHAEAQRAAAALEFAERELQREQTLAQRGATTEQAIEQAALQRQTLASALQSAQFAENVAAHELQMAQLAVQRPAAQTGEAPIVVRAPVSAQVLKVLQQSAGVVQPGAPLIELGDLAALELVADVLSSDAAQIDKGAHAFVERWGGPQTLAAHVRSVEPSAFTRVSALGVEEQRVHVVLDLDAPRAAWAALGDGYRVLVKIVTWQTGSALTVPASALFRHGDAWAAFAVGEDGRARRVTLQTGHANAERFELLAGLSDQARVIVHPSDRIKDAARVAER